MNIGSISEMYTGDYAPLSDRYQAAYRFGVRFFEIRFPRPIQNPQPLFGCFDIDVQEEIDPVNARPFYETKILTAPLAQVRFEPINDKGSAVAFMFDDEFWHNRIVMIDNKWLLNNFVAIHSRDGVVPASSARIELIALEEVVNEDVVIWKLMNEHGKEVTFFRNEREKSKGFTKEYEDQGYYIEEGTMRVKSKFCQDLIKRYDRGRYGWTDCEEFREDIVPKVNELIKKRRIQTIAKNPTAGDSTAVLTELLSNLSKDTIVEILKSIQNKADIASEAKRDEQDALLPPVRLTEKGLMRKSKEDLRMIAEKMGVDKAKIDRGTNKDLIAEILKKQDENGDIPETEDTGSSFNDNVQEEEEEVIT